MTEANDAIFQRWVNPKMLEAFEKQEPYMMVAEPTSKCYGSCAYCYASSTEFIETIWSTERALDLLDEAGALGIGFICWAGGDPIEHPDFFKLVDYAAEKGMEQNITLSGLVSKEVAKKIKRAYNNQNSLQLSIHIDSIIPEVYNRVHTDPSTLEKKILGYKTILETGFPPGQIVGLIHLARPVIETVPETTDWFIDEMGAPFVAYVGMKPCGFGADHLDWEYSKSDLKMVTEYRAKKVGEYWLKLGPTEFGRYNCDSNIYVYPNGDVGCCSCLRHVPQFIAGNINRGSFIDIVKKNKDMLLFNFEVEGRCAICSYNPYCRGCRAAAYFATGDVTAPDPKCYRNPENTEEYVYQKKSAPGPEMRTRPPLHMLALC